MNDLTDFHQDLIWRGLISGFANEKNFLELKESERTIYLGVDCTGESLHIGHLFLLFQVVRFIDRGFKVFLILGGATSKIGDPSDKISERLILQDEIIEKNRQKLQKQMFKIFAFELPEIDNKVPLEKFYSSDLREKIYEIMKIDNSQSKKEQWRSFSSYIFPKRREEVTFLDNSNWLAKISFLEFVNRVGKNITLNYLLAKDWTKRRLKSGGLSYLAFNYSLLQAYDFFYLYKNHSCYGQIGGSDQWGNLTTGLKLIHNYYPVNKAFAVNFKLLTGRDGKKFAKSSEEKKNILFLNANENTFYDFFRNMEDEIARDYIKKLTFLNQEQINELEKINNPPKLRIFQHLLFELILLLNRRNLS